MPVWKKVPPGIALVVSLLLLFYSAGPLEGQGVEPAGALPDGPGKELVALWNMARLQLPVIVVVYNNHAYGGPHNRATSAFPEGRMVQTGKFVHDYLGNPDMNMAKIAEGFGVASEVVELPAQLQQALARARRAAAEGKPYLIDAQVRRAGAGWAEKPWTPTVQVAQQARRG